MDMYTTWEVFVQGALQYLIPALFFTALFAIALAWGIRLGGIWLLKAIAEDIHLEEWLHQIFRNTNQTDNKMS